MHALLQRLSELTGSINRGTAELLRILSEIDEKKLYLEQACSSLFSYLVERLNYAEGAAAKRIGAARAARRFPLVLDMVAKGDLHLAGVYTLAPHLTEENYRAVLERARGQSKRQIERLVVELSPKPEQPSLIRACPQAQRPASPVTESREPAPPLPPPGATIAPKPRAVVPVTPRRYQIRITVDEKTHGQLEKLQNLLAHQIPDRDPAAVIARALELLLRDTLAKKAAITDKPRKQRRAGSRSSRHIPAAIRRQVWQRDQGQCSFRDDQGRRCSAETVLEFHHVEPWGKGGEHSVAQITLRCRSHNQYQAVLDYGTAFMTAKRNTEKS
jgi:hypothetical protein